MTGQSDTEQGGQGGGQEKKEHRGTITNLREYLFDGKAGMWTAMSTAVMCVFTGLLWHVSDLANQANITTQRAILSENGPIWGKVNTPDGQHLRGFNVVYNVANSGNLPAKNGAAQYNLSLGDERPVKGLDFGTLNQSKTTPFVIGPKNGLQLPILFISVEDMEAVELGRKHLFFWGWATYNDGFSNSPRRLTEFCTDVTTVIWSKVDHADPTVDIALNTPPCEVHNCYDEQCEDYSSRTK